MKKFLSVIFLSFFITASSIAKNMPLYTTSINNYGVGVINMPQEFNIYEQPNFKSKTVAHYKWGNSTGAYIHDSDLSDNFVIYNPSKNQAYMTVTTDSDGDGWYEVCYDHKNNLTGWVAPEKYTYYPWLSFFTKFGKTNGLYAFRDIPVELKRLHSHPDFESQVINSFEKAKNIRVQIFRGNWVLVRVYDYDGKLMIGWLKWRTDEGKFNYFPNVK